LTRALLIATGNAHKAEEITELLGGLPLVIQSLADHPPVESPVEDGETFEANAVKKAAHYCEQLDVPCVADDSGLVVDALDGAPGVYSARYAGPGCTDADNNTKLLAALADVAESARTARFVCCAAVAEPGGGVHVESGAVEGRIGYVCRGENGFGYDPLFLPDGQGGKSFGELTAAIKQSISHRARAFGRVRVYLESSW
jgi:XTP/dITP diphosphohydrolase